MSEENSVPYTQDLESKIAKDRTIIERKIEILLTTRGKAHSIQEVSSTITYMGHDIKHVRSTMRRMIEKGTLFLNDEMLLEYRAQQTPRGVHQFYGVRNC
jgi:hypothetical protein